MTEKQEDDEWSKAIVEMGNKFWCNMQEKWSEREPQNGQECLKIPLLKLLCQMSINRAWDVVH